MRQISCKCRGMCTCQETLLAACYAPRDPWVNPPKDVRRRSREDVSFVTPSFLAFPLTSTTRPQNMDMNEDGRPILRFTSLALCKLCKSIAVDFSKPSPTEEDLSSMAYFQRKYQPVKVPATVINSQRDADNAIPYEVPTVLPRTDCRKREQLSILYVSRRRVESQAIIGVVSSRYRQVCDYSTRVRSSGGLWSL